MKIALPSIFRLLASGLPLLCICGAYAEPSVNLLPNPSFEKSDVISPETPLPGWSISTSADKDVPLSSDEMMLVDDPTQARSGRKFLRLKPSKRGIFIRSPLFGDFEPGLYEVSAWVKGSPGVAGPMGLSAIGASFGAGIQPRRDQWQKFSMIVYTDGIKNFPWKEQTGLYLGAKQREGAVMDLDSLSVTRLSSGLAGAFSDHMVLQRDRPLPVWGWAMNPGQEVKVEMNGQTKTATADKEGRWKVEFEPMPAGGPYVLSLDGVPTAYDVMLGDVWVCTGQSNMDFGLDFVSKGYFGHSPEALAEADLPMVRLWTAPKQFSMEPMSVYKLQQDSSQNNYQANWNVSSPTTASWGVWGGFSAVGLYFGREIQADQKVAIGLMQITNGGTQIESFMNKESLQKVPQELWVVPPIEATANAPLGNDPFPSLPDTIQPTSEAYGEAIRSVMRLEQKPKIDGKSFNYANALYNGMISPISPYAIKGVIWYQGEHNGGDVNYAVKLKAFIEQWRRAQNNPKMPFIIAQLCNWKNDKVKGDGFGIARDAQLRVAKEDPLVGLAVTLDLANTDGGYGPAEIHPNNKKDVGLRMALAAKEIAYGEKLVSSGPIYQSMKVEGDKIQLSFDSVGGGLVAKDGDTLSGFRIAGSDQNFVPAKAVIEGDKVVVSADGVSNPEAVRYAFGQFIPKFNLYNKEGLPASPFRTDDWVLK